MYTTTICKALLTRGYLQATGILCRYKRIDCDSSLYICTRIRRIRDEASSTLPAMSFVGTLPTQVATYLRTSLLIFYKKEETSFHHFPAFPWWRGMLYGLYFFQCMGGSKNCFYFDDFVCSCTYHHLTS